MSQNLRDYTKALYTLDGVVRRVDDAAWDNASPNEEWSAKETLGHVIWGLKRVANNARDADAPAAQPEAEVAGSDPKSSWTEAFDDVLDALDSRGVLAKMVETPFGTMSIDDAIGAFFVDPLTHAWDIAKAAGIEPVIPEDLSKKALAMLAAGGDALRRPGGLGPIVDVDEAASSADKFIATTGRTPSS